MSNVLSICINNCNYNGNYFFVGDIVNVEDGFGLYRHYKLLYSEEYDYYIGAIDPSIIEENFASEDLINEIDNKFKKIIYG